MPAPPRLRGAGIADSLLEIWFYVAIGGQVACLYKRDKRIVTDFHQTRRLGTNLLDDRSGALDQGFCGDTITVPGRAAYVEAGRFKIFPRHLRV